MFEILINFVCSLRDMLEIAGTKKRAQNIDPRVEPLGLAGVMRVTRTNPNFINLIYTYIYMQDYNTIM